METNNELDWLSDRLVADSTNRDEWLAARNTGITASNAGNLVTEKSLDSIVKSKFFTDFVGNPATEWGLEREPILLNWAGFTQNTWLIKAEDNPRFLATPDGIRNNGSVELCQVKTSSKPLGKIPANYYRQMQWEMYVVGADKNLLVWEQHENFIPVDSEPVSLWIERDEETINKLKKLAEVLLRRLDEANAFEKEMME